MMECFLVVSDILHSIRVLCNGFEKKVIIAEIFETKVLTGEYIVVIITITFETKGDFHYENESSETSRGK